jgi:mannose/fructose/N-acetylgalactosamine-specific phosphotransferase system component IID
VKPCRCWAFCHGGVAASYVKLGTGLEFITKDGVNIHVQQMLDGIFPQLLPLMVVLGTGI